MRNGMYRQFTLLFFLLMAVINISIAETIDKGEIKFKRGSTSGTVSGAVIRGERDHYFLIAGAGQWMKVEIDSEEDNAVFQLSIYSYGSGEDIQLDGAKDGEDAKYWYGQLPNPAYSKDGEQNVVDIIVGGTRGNASYDLTVTITNQDTTKKSSQSSKSKSSKSNNVQPNSANGKYHRLLQTLRCPKDKHQYGEFNDYGYWEGGAWCGQIGQAGYWVWENPNWYVWAEKTKVLGKTMSGRVTSLESGDIACYVNFDDDNGNEYTELADFEICEQTQFINKKVSFSYTQTEVMSADCEGDPECTLSETVWIIKGIKKQ